jgi:hypothetical protein
MKTTNLDDILTVDLVTSLAWFLKKKDVGWRIGSLGHCFAQQELRPD